MNQLADPRSALRALQVLPPFPRVARKLMVLAGKTDVGFQEIAELIRSDAGLSLQVLRLANSPLMSPRQPISSILRAIVLIGTERIKGLAVTAAIKTYLGHLLEGDSEPSLLMVRCWRENLVCALIAEEMAKPCWLDPDTAYTAGLLHDFGRLSLLKAFPASYCSLLKSAASDDDGLLAQERETLGIDHCMAGAWLAESWEFPADLVAVIASHHKPPAGERFGMTGLIHATRLAAAMLDFQSVGDAVPWDLEKIQACLETGRGHQFQANEKEFARKFAADVNAIECSLI